MRKLINEESAKRRKSMLLVQKEKADSMMIGVEEKAKKAFKKSDSQILMDSLNFSKFQTFMPLPKDDGQTCKKFR